MVDLADHSREPIRPLVTCLFPQVAVPLAYANNTNGSQNCPGNTNSQNDGPDCENEAGCTNAPDPEKTVENVDRWTAAPAIDVPADLEIAGPTLLCVGGTTSYSFDRPGQSGALDHGVTDHDTNTTGTLTTWNKVDDTQPDCPTVPDYSEDDLSDSEEPDSISHDWSVTGGGTIQKDNQGYGDFTAPSSGRTVTIKATFSDGAPSVSDGDRDDTDKDETLQVKVVEVVDLKPNLSSSPVDTIQTGSPGVDTDVWFVPIDKSTASSTSTFKVLTTLNPSLTSNEQERLIADGCWVVEVFDSDTIGTQGLSTTGSPVNKWGEVTLPLGTQQSYLIYSTAGTSHKRILVHVVDLQLTLDRNENSVPNNASDLDEDERDEETEGVALFVSTTAPNGTSPDAAAKMRLWTTTQPVISQKTDVVLSSEGDDCIQVWSVVGAHWTKESLPLRMSLDASLPELWVEGISKGEINLVLKREHDGSATELEDKVKISVADMKLVWEAKSGNIAPDSNSNEGGGLRIYPGKKDPTDTGTRNTILLKATLSSGQAGVKVYFNVVDMDDPSANGPPIDLSNHLADDNRGTGVFVTGTDEGDGIYSAVTDQSGAATVEYRVAYNPGDNYCAAAYVDKQSALTLWDGGSNRLVHWVNGETVQVPSNHATPLLTVWRKLWVEVDRMSPPDVTEQYYSGSGPIASVTPNATTGRTEINLGNNLPDHWSDLNMYEEGKIKIVGMPAGATSEYVVYSNSANYFANDTVVVEGIVPTSVIGKSYELYDDDDYTRLNHNPTAGAKGDEEFGRAYIKLEYPALYQDPFITFHRWLTKTEVATGVAWTQQRDLHSSTELWSHLLVGVFQQSQNEDFDPDARNSLDTPASTPAGAETGSLGLTDAGNAVMDGIAGSVIYMEHILDWFENDMTKVHGTSTHELGHVRKGNSVHDEGGLMSEGQVHGKFKDETIDRLRDMTKW